MSDTEAGDSELPENPEPEDDADLSTHHSSRAAGEPGEPELVESESSESLFQHAGEAQSTKNQGNSSSGLASDSVVKYAHNGNGDNSETSAEVCKGSDTPENAVSDKSEMPPGSAAELEWPPESERDDRSTIASSALPDTIKNSDSVEASSLGTARENSPLSGTESSNSLQSAETHPEDEIQKCDEDSNKGQNDHPSRNSMESSDPEESPPEDELFRIRAASVQDDSADTANPAPESETASAVSSTDVASQNLVSHSTDNAATVEHECGNTQAEQKAADGEATESASVSANQSSETQVESTGGLSAVGREDDQVPECDRKQTVSSSEPFAAAVGTKAVTQNEEKESNAQDERSVCDNDITAVSVTGSQSSQQLESASGSAGSGNSLQENVCERSNASDSQTMAAQSCVSTSHLENSGKQQAERATKNTSANASSKQQQRSTFLDIDSDDEDLLTELDAELHMSTSPRRQQQQQHSHAVPSQLSLNGLKQLDGSNSELCKQFEEQLLQLQEMVLQKDREIHRLEEEKARQRQVSQEVMAERDKYKAELVALKDKNPDDLYLPQIKELEYTIAQQQAEIRQLKDKLTSHDGAAKRAIATLQSEMKTRIDQITKLYEDTSKEKDSMVIRFAEAETKNIEAKRAVEKMEAKVRDVLKEKEFLNNKMRAAVTEKQKAAADLEAKVGEMAVLQKEVEKLKEELSSADYRIKWFQNKLKAELEAHKETKQTLEKTTVKLKEAKEETEVIRRDCQAIIKTYQESEEVRSNSLDKELRLKETELLIQRKEKSDTEEVHLQTKKELDALKVKHKDDIEELKTLRDKVQCLEEERLQSEQVQSKYQTIIQNQKAENANLQKQLADFRTLREDFDRAQDMIKTLDHEISDLKITNRDLTKDIEGCQERESKMLALQSELSRTNALLRSENTNFNNQVVTLSGEVQKMTMDLQDLETRCRNVTEQLEEEQRKRAEETATLSTQLAAKTKECEEYKQKWEDEMDINKTLKRKHAHNVKDLTRQLQHAKKRLEAYETGSGDREGTSMGSRTNSNGSLNSMDASNQHNANQHNHGQHNHQPSSALPRRQSQEPEFPVIAEQVEVDKQMLIERIVRLQRSLARKNEKLEFLEEHIQQLVTEIKNKNKIIQGYVMREEAGTLVSDDMDAHKALLARKGGIMASVYSMHQQDGTMTLDLSLEINRKLQAVLEDTLLKNMTLKENLDTLGAEIARLSQENRRLQLHLQQIEAH